MSYPKTDAVLDIQIPIAKIGTSNLTNLLSPPSIYYDDLVNFASPFIDNCFISKFIDTEIFDYAEFNQLFEPLLIIENIDFKKTF